MASSDQSSIKCFVHNIQEDEFNNEKEESLNFVGVNPEEDIEVPSKQDFEDDELLDSVFGSEATPEDTEVTSEEDSEDDDQVNSELFVEATPKDNGNDDTLSLFDVSECLNAVNTELERDGLLPKIKDTSDENTNPLIEKAGPLLFYLKKNCTFANAAGLTLFGGISFLLFRSFFRRS